MNTHTIPQKMRLEFYKLDQHMQKMLESYIIDATIKWLRNTHLSDIWHGMPPLSDSDTNQH